MRSLLAAIPLIALTLTACARSTPAPAPSSGERPRAEATSLFGEPLVSPELPAEVRADREARLAEAQAAATAAPDDPDALIWLGRRIAYLGRHREAVDVYTRGIERFPRDARFLRHRGHRYITLRRFDLATADLEKAAELIAGRPDEVEPDGLPNAAGIPTSTLQSNIWYHLGLAHYLQGDFDQSLRAYRECLKVSNNPDMQVATRYWLYMTLRRLGRAAGSPEVAEVLEPVRLDMKILENQAYHKLLLMFRGELPPEALLAAGGDDVDPATTGYGVGNWYLVEGRKEEAVDLFAHVVETGPWSAFGAIAAEADLYRLGERRR
ncbi:MAG TPA: tetratricopeptide repeat protein [Thermoanaerobaculia bacterium]|nr:tetratricopeptide repeat protein [Thermoanaerobaculia bacterium]